MSRISNTGLNVAIRRATWRRRLKSRTLWLSVLFVASVMVTYKQRYNGSSRGTSNVMYWDTDADNNNQLSIKQESTIAVVDTAMHHSKHRHHNHEYNESTINTRADGRQSKVDDDMRTYNMAIPTFVWPRPFNWGKSDQSQQQATNDTTQQQGTADAPPQDEETDETRAKEQEDAMSLAFNDPPQFANPSLFGWTPEQYPNPVYNPLRCGIANLSLNYTGSGDFYYDNIRQQQQQDPHLYKRPLRLCDPDWVLGGTNLPMIATAMHNFSATFSANGPYSGSLGSSTNDNTLGNNSVRVRNNDNENISPMAESYIQRHPDYNDTDDYNINVHHNIGSTNSNANTENIVVTPQTLELAVATVRKMNLPAVLRDGSYYAYEDEDDMINDAAQIFAHHLHSKWWDSRGGTSDVINDEDAQTNGGGSGSSSTNSPDWGILIFLSIQDRVCFIHTDGDYLSVILPWWRLDHVVARMKAPLRQREYGLALIQAINELEWLLQQGPPTWTDRWHDFVARFGVVLAFAGVTLVFGAYGEYRDRRQRWQYAEERSQLSAVDREKASMLQQEYKTRTCPICLENFKSSCFDNDDIERSDKSVANDGLKPITASASYKSLDSAGDRPSRVDSLGVPLRGADGKKIKLLRCGHVFCETCWKSWVHSGCGNPCNCPVCRQDVGMTPRKGRRRSRSLTSRRRRRREQQRQRQERLREQGGSEESNNVNNNNALVNAAESESLLPSNNDEDEFYSNSENEDFDDDDDDYIYDGDNDDEEEDDDNDIESSPNERTSFMAAARSYNSMGMPR